MTGLCATTDSLAFNNIGSEVDRPSGDHCQFIVPAQRLFAVPAIILCAAAVHTTEVTSDLVKNRRGKLAVGNRGTHEPGVQVEVAKSG